ncbi:cytochrome P450 [Novosphingobium sp. MBES04]|uniref:cytochrome P450 n=1 Tax=Novosphingobium sp. MBES04 TaxID=1206458 RepID=UPI0005800D02|nr:cytochrome P450 [Novosphingobium sp. MBES04]GAM04122.1 cytochrome P450 [Novosphingobium sp. MBES04]
MDHVKADWYPMAHTDMDARMEQMAAVRAGCPVARSDHYGGVYTVLRYADLKAVASDPATFSSGGDPRFGARLPPLEVDPPEHTVFRRVLQRFWLPSRIRAMEPSVREKAIALIDPVVAARGGDLAREIAYPLPVFALCILLGIEPENWMQIKQWAEEQLGGLSDDPEVKARAVAAHEHLLAHVRTIVDDRKLRPRSPDSDIASALLEVRQDGQPLDEALVAGVLRILISAGHNSTTNALGNCMLYLASHPEAQDMLRAEPARIPVAVEELLRWESPVQELPRWATKDTEIGDRPIKAGDRIAMLWGSGNRDEAVFDQPEECRLDRKPNRHLAFGYGIHTCLGAPMARMELRVVLEELLRRTDRFEISGSVVRKPYHHVGVAHLPVDIVPRGFSASA